MRRPQPKGLSTASLRHLELKVMATELALISARHRRSNPAHASEIDALEWELERLRRDHANLWAHLEADQAMARESQHQSEHHRREATEQDDFLQKALLALVVGASLGITLSAISKKGRSTDP